MAVLESEDVAQLLKTSQNDVICDLAVEGKAEVDCLMKHV